MVSRCRHTNPLTCAYTSSCSWGHCTSASSRRRHGLGTLQTAFFLSFFQGRILNTPLFKLFIISSSQIAEIKEIKPESDPGNNNSRAVLGVVWYYRPEHVVGGRKVRCLFIIFIFIIYHARKLKPHKYRYSTDNMNYLQATTKMKSTPQQ